MKLVNYFYIGGIVEYFVLWDVDEFFCDVCEKVCVICERIVIECYGGVLLVFVFMGVD